MGMYINEINGMFIGSGFNLKVANLTNAGAKKIEEPKEWEEGLVCVVDNGLFGAAGYCFDAEELEAFKYPDNRRKQWLKMNDAKTYAV